MRSIDADKLEHDMIENDLQAIRSVTGKMLSDLDVYTFTIRLCDNEIDRDFERFATQTLEELAPMFVGKSGILDYHYLTGKQMARIYRTEVVYDPARLTKAGDCYCWLKGYAYMLRNDNNKDLIAEMDNGIKKEVSVGCAVKQVLCSICGESLYRCTHERGSEYDGQFCYGVLTNATDAYEWAFVITPTKTKD